MVNRGRHQVENLRLPHCTKGAVLAVFHNPTLSCFFLCGLFHCLGVLSSMYGVDRVLSFRQNRNSSLRPRQWPCRLQQRDRIDRFPARYHPVLRSAGAATAGTLTASSLQATLLIGQNGSIRLSRALVNVRERTVRSRPLNRGTNKIMAISVTIGVSIWAFAQHGK